MSAISEKAEGMSIEELVSEVKIEQDTIDQNLAQVTRGNKSAARRVRVATLNIQALYFELRKKTK